MSLTHYPSCSCHPCCQRTSSRSNFACSKPRQVAKVLRHTCAWLRSVSCSHNSKPAQGYSACKHSQGVGCGHADGRGLCLEYVGVWVRCLWWRCWRQFWSYLLQVLLLLLPPCHILQPADPDRSDPPLLACSSHHVLYAGMALAQLTSLHLTTDKQQDRQAHQHKLVPNTCRLMDACYLPQPFRPKS